MKIVLAPDSFKQSMTSKQAIDAMVSGISSILPKANIIGVPMADGGEGTVDSLVHATHGYFVSTTVLNPFKQPVDARYGILGDSNTAVIEMSAASGIQYTSKHHMAPMTGTSYGTGQLVVDALNRHVKQIMIGLGGSATTDGGEGLASALGVRFYDSNHHLIKAEGGKGLSQIEQIDLSHLDQRLKTTKILMASDVSNPLVGPKGAAHVFAPQKGANHEMVIQLDQNLKHYGQIIQKDLGKNILDVHGAGAAGGLGAGLLAFTNAKIHHGIQLVIATTHLKAKLKNADIVITGEGSIDDQTQYGKTPIGVAKTAKEVAPNALVIALGGRVKLSDDHLYQLGIDAILPIVPGAINLSDAMKSGPQNIKLVANNIARIIKHNHLLFNSK
ncbi:glycerate kinase [Philodulcilactobacillus myokoensis]|uniref:Glycerate kinase n=1 Tax=Philodulcilactobacillus myokoensis TaxID=2929573 RepID=A0A9W6B0C7_9LACO|nr:glycerate kinase [Philodulcilactobacillus myokoensis]GLB46451.1 glycerate kinase [Philodulcilactobacillus myokoensis]